jgi:hypothetical protein
MSNGASPRRAKTPVHVEPQVFDLPVYWCRTATALSVRRISLLQSARARCVAQSARGLSDLVDSLERKGVALQPARLRRRWISENSKANRIETMKGPAESGEICSVEVE